MFPAARKGDPITHDLLVPSGVIGPPITGPCPMGLVMIEGLPAAHVNCTVVCTGVITGGLAHPPPPGPPPPIILGSPTVYIHAMMAARWAPSGDIGACGVFLGDPKLAVMRRTLIGGPSASVSVAGGVMTAKWGAMTITGSPDDVRLFLEMIAQESSRSDTFRSLMSRITSNSANPISVDLVRGDPSVWVDAYNGNGSQTINMDYFDRGEFPESSPANHPESVTRGENLVHALDEAHHGASLQNSQGNDPSGNNWYNESHNHAIDAENDYRGDRGQTTDLQHSNGGPGPDDVTFEFDDGSQEIHNQNTGAVTHLDPAGNVVP